MSGRRTHSRFIASPVLDGVLRVMRDVTVEQANASELVVVSREAFAAEQTLTCEISEIESPVHVVVQVVESRPFMADGGVRHRLRLRRVGSTEPGSTNGHGRSHTTEEPT